MAKKSLVKEEPEFVLEHGFVCLKDPEEKNLDSMLLIKTLWTKKNTFRVSWGTKKYEHFLRFCNECLYKKNSKMVVTLVARSERLGDDAYQILFKCGLQKDTVVMGQSFLKEFGLSKKTAGTRKETPMYASAHP